MKMWKQKKTSRRRKNDKKIAEAFREEREQDIKRQEQFKQDLDEFIKERERDYENSKFN